MNASALFITKRRWFIAIAVGLYLYFLLPATAVLFYELYHLTGIGPIYWGYSVFKAGGYYFGIWEYQLISCVLVSALIIGIPAIVSRVRQP
jgi:hypothetical protein